MNNVKKGGRPKIKLPTKKRDMQINIRVSYRDMLVLIDRFEKAKLSRSDFIRQAILTGEIKERMSPELMQMIRQLCGMANNLNQIARKANAAGYINARLEYLDLADRIHNLLNSVEL